MRQKFPATLVFVAYFVGIGLWFIWQLSIKGGLLNLGLLSQSGFWLLGGLIGYYLLTLDRLVDVFLVHPATELADQVRQRLKQGRYLEGLKLLEQNKQAQLRLSFRSAGFQVIWIALAFFALTSTISYFGKGVVLGLGLHLLLDEWEDYLVDPEYLKQWLFWQTKRQVSLKELKVYLWSMTLGFGFLSLALL